MKTTSIKLPPDLAKRTEALKHAIGLSEAAILRAAIVAGLARVEYGVRVMTEPHAPSKPKTAKEKGHETGI